MAIAEKFENVTVLSKANVYFDGKVVSYTVILNDGEKKTVGLIFPGTYTFNTGVPEKMEIVAGNCTVKIKGQNERVEFKAGEFFSVPGNSAFEITVDSGIAEYICSYL
ncbi:MAG: pyrimidine/purine nucleoside phosphorylase [Fibrobacter sp.]|nr:pyrimidine/purine nucleoside phosphorylase [Fibrobacter sp.]